MASVSEFNLQPEDFEVLMVAGVLAPLTTDELREALDRDLVGVESALDRLAAAGFIVRTGTEISLTWAGHKNLSRRRLRRVRDIGRMLYLWRRSRGTR